jgi:hypothetical protein
VHISLLAWPFYMVGFLGGGCLSRSYGTFLSMEWWPCTFLSVSLPCSVSRVCTISTVFMFRYLFSCFLPMKILKSLYFFFFFLVGSVTPACTHKVGILGCQLSFL